jgi:hypothetical protein
MRALVAAAAASPDTVGPFLADQVYAENYHIGQVWIPKGLYV